MRFGPLFIILSSITTWAQPNWNVEASFSSSTTTLHSNYDGKLLVGTSEGLYLKTSAGWQLAPVGGFINGIYSHADWGTWVASSSGLWQSYNCVNWQLRTTPFTATVHDMIFTDELATMATAEQGSINGIGTYEGQGIFALNNQGTWSERNTGITGSLSIWQLEESPAGWLAVGADDQIQSGPTTMYISKNQGLSWTPLKVSYVDPDSQTSFPLQITYPLALLNCPNGTLFSVEGKLGNLPAFFGSEVVISQDTAFLYPFSLVPTSLPFQSSHPTTLQWKKNQLFASRMSFGLNYTPELTQAFSSLNQGFTPMYYSGGLPRFYPVFVEENQAGELFAIQHSDYSLYTISPGLTTPEPTPKESEPSISCYPNPTRGKLYLTTQLSINQVIITHPNGIVVAQIKIQKNEPLDLDLAPGLYLLLFIDNNGNQYPQKIVVQ